MMHNHEKGDIAEQQAAEYMRGQQYTILDRNFRCKLGEIDCIAQAPDGTIVFIEVKAGFSDSKGHPFYRINIHKQRRIIRIAQYYLLQRNLYRRPCRFDVIGITNGTIEHLKNAFLTS